MSQIVNLRQMQVGQQGKIAAVEALGEMNRRIRDHGPHPRHHGFHSGPRAPQRPRGPAPFGRHYFAAQQ